MTPDPFYQLAPFIQEYIYRHKWQELRAVQVQAIDAILNGQEHILICSATASGKTEAALLPIITQLQADPPRSIGLLYIGPLKALINDQFARLNLLLEETDIPVQSWHGDVSQTKKRRFLKRARGILQITPESLEAMLMRRHHELGRLFSDLCFVVIDEVHAFIDSDRGRQVMCQLERLARAQATPARRIGLSATVGEPQVALDWLRGNSPRAGHIIEIAAQARVELGLEYYLLLEPEARGAPAKKPIGASKLKKQSAPEINALLVSEGHYYQNMHWMTQRVPKTLIFGNSRENTESIILNMRKISDAERKPSFYHVHHGSIAAPLREAAEAAMKTDDSPACVAATVTLELGIDLGQLDQVLQVNATHSVSSFVQRLGRSGRRGGPARMFFYCTERQAEAEHFGQEIPWNLLQTIAIIQLYLEEKWLEPPQLPRLPLSLLYHQTMSIIYAHTEIAPPALAERVLTLSPFAHVTVEHFRQLLRHLLEIEHLERSERGGLIIGLAAEKMVNHYRFYATFMDEVLYRVRDKAREIGTIQALPEIDSTFILAGRIWRVLAVDEERRIIEVERASGPARTPWHGGAPLIHRRILQKMRELLLSNSSIGYITPRARERLELARATAGRAGLAESSLLPFAADRFLLLPWCGTREFDTLKYLLAQNGFIPPASDSYAPYYIEVVADCAEPGELKQRLLALCAPLPAPADLVERVETYQLYQNKFDRYVPADLLRQAYAADYLDVPGAAASLQAL